MSVKNILRAVYATVPFKRTIFFFIRKIFSPKEFIYQYLHFQGEMDIKLPDGEEFKLYANHSQFENELFWGGIENCWEQTSLPIWIKLSRDSDVIFDIGAQSGIFSMVSKAVNPKSIVHAFEPTEKFYGDLKRNNFINGFNIECHKSAVSNKNGKNSIETVWQENKTVQSITMDSFIESNNIEKIDLIKVDIDFHEPEFAEGFQKYFKLFQPTILIEVLKDEIAQQIEKFLNTQELGYLIFSIHEKNGTIRQLPNMLKRGDNMNFLICKPDIALSLGLNNRY